MERRRSSGEVEVLAVLLAADVQREVRPLGVAAQGAAERLLARTHGVLTGVLTARRERERERFNILESFDGYDAATSTAELARKLVF